jgi:hypothetical protein
MPLPPTTTTSHPARAHLEAPVEFLQLHGCLTLAQPLRYCGDALRPQMSPRFASFVQVSHLHFHGMFLTRSDYDRGLPAAASAASIHLTRATLQVSTRFHQRAVCFRLSAARRCLQLSSEVADVFF